MRSTNNAGPRSPGSSPSGSTTLKIGARLRMLSQKSEESEEPNPFAISKSPSKAETPRKAPSAEASNENPFAITEGLNAAPENPFSFAPKRAPSQETAPTARAALNLPQAFASPFETPALHSPFETPSMEALIASLEPDPSTPPATTEAEPRPERPEVKASEPLLKPPAGPPALPPLPASEKKDLRASLLERAVKKQPSGELSLASTPTDAKPNPKPMGLKPPAPSLPKPPPPIQAKPGAKPGLMAPPKPAAPLMPPAPIKPAPQPLLAKAPTPSPEPLPPPPALPVAAISESIELDDFSAVFEEDFSPPPRIEPPALDELEAISNQMDSLSDELEAIKPDHEPPPYQPPPVLPRKASSVPPPAEEADEFSVALQALVPDEDRNENPFRTPALQQAAQPEVSEHSLIALSLDKATDAVDSLFGGFMETSREPAASYNTPQAAKSTSIELDDEDMEIEPTRAPQHSASNPFELDEEDLVIDAQGGSAISSLAERAALYRKGLRWRELTEVLKEIAARSQEPFQLWVEIAELQWDKLQDQIQAFASYQKALMLQPKNERFLEKLLTRYFDAGRWDEGFEIIERIGILAPSANERSKRFHEAALVLHQKYQQSDIALELFNEALDIDVQVLEAFEQIDRILTKRRDWSLLEQNYRRMVLRVPESQRALLVMLWHNLGEIYRTRLSMMRQAAEAFEEASRLDPTNPTRQKILAELYATDPSQWERTAEHERRLLATGVDKQRSLHSLFKIYTRAGQKDLAFCAASVLVSLGDSTPEEDTFYAHGLGVTPRIPSLPIPDQAFRRFIAPKEEDSSLSAIFRLISPYAVLLYARTEKESGLHKKERVEGAQARFPFLRSLQELTKLLQLPTPAVYVNPNPGPEEPPNTGLDLEPLLLERAFVPGLIAGPTALSPRREADTLFLLARHLVYLRPEYIFIRLCRVHQGLLKILLRAAISLVNPSIPLPKEEEEEILQIAKRLSREVPAAIVGQIKLAVDEAIRAGNDFSTTRWMTQVELAATRAAFVVSGDLEAATRVLQSDTTPLSVLSTKAKLHDLHLYAISEEYSALREELKISWPPGR